MYSTDDIRIRETKELRSPEDLINEYPVSEKASETVHNVRLQMRAILDGEDDRLAVVVGPCSIHDPKAARDYASRLLEQRNRLQDDLLVIMRVYFEKPRTTIGWKGLINDPQLDDSYHINEGLRIARSLLLDINEMGLPAGTEYLDLISPQYIADLVGWGAIGARTTESQAHRELASGLSCPVGFKNGTSGNVQIAIDAIGSAMHPHHFLSVTKEGRSAIFATSGNTDCHLILRGGAEHVNYDAASVDLAAERMSRSGVPVRMMVDFSHANSRKKFARQKYVCQDVCTQIGGGDERIKGVMIESNLVEGNQKLLTDRELVYGQSITDACVGWDDTETMLTMLAEAVRRRRECAGKNDA
ncbi:MAG: 3-deoxy-7-phosphoheptulonate synthase [Gammaproteobacteria bacterium]|nr:3-deoxy-7-phosphoheptulonate synthase [Gammaproteobacteria bacterium]